MSPPDMDSARGMAGFSLRPEHARHLGGESPLSSLIVSKRKGVVVRRSPKEG
jgi:hypothetical protein